MSLTLTVEDGSIVANANSYATLAQCRAYCAQRGTVLPVDDDALTELLTSALDLIESFEPRFKGKRVSPSLQVLSWPRMCVWVYGSQFAGDPALLSTVIPIQLINAQCYAAGVASTVDLNPVQDTRAVTKEVIGPLETDYDTKSGATLRPIIPQLESMLTPLMNFGTGMLRTVRV